MQIKYRLSTASSLGLLALLFSFAYAQQQSAQISASGSPSSATQTSTSASPVVTSTTVVSTITTTLSRGQSLPSSLTASASLSGSVWYVPVITAIPVTSTTSSAPAATATTNSTAPASESSANNATTTLPLRTIIDPAFGVLGAILIITGLPMTFYGHRNRWSSYFLSGFFALALICVSIILKVGVESAVNPPSKAIRGLFLVAAVIAGAVGGAISIVFWRGAGLLACGLGGFFFGLFLQALRPGGLIRPVGLRFILYFGLYAIFFTVSCNGRAHSLVLALATAIIGATALTLGIDCYSTQGLKEFYVRNLGLDSLFQNKYPPTFQNGRFPLVQGMQIELGVLGALILMGFAFQMRLWSDIRTQLAALKRSDERRNMRSKAELAARAVARTAKRDLAEWEARHGYNKTASRNIAGKDEENGVQSAPSADLKDNRSRTSSFMTLFRANTDGTQLLMPLSPTEKIAHSPAASSVLDNNAYPFPAQTASRHSANFLEYIQKGPEPVEAEGPLRLDLPSLTSALDLGPSHPATAASEAIPMSPVHSVKMGDMPRSTSLFASQQQPSVDPTRSAPSETITGVGSFRQRSASTAALMDNSASFMDIAPVQKEPSNPPSLSSSALVSETGQFNNADRRTQSLSLTTASALGTDTVRSNQSPAFGSHERTFSNPMAPTASSLAGAAPMTKSSSHQDQLRSYSPAVYAQPYPEAHAEPRVTQVPQQTSLPSPDFGAVKTITGGQSNAVMQARRSLASRRSDQAAVPWTNPGAENAAAAHQRTRSADAQSRMRAMSIEELEARHRAKLTAMQAPATQTVQEAEALRRAKDEWERKQKIERRRMQEREAQKAAAAATAAAARPTMSGSASNGRVASPVQGSFDLARASSPSVRDERRRSRNLSATLLEAVGEEGREGGGANRAAQWRQSISGVEQLDPRASRASNPGTPTSTRPTSPQPTSALERATPTPSPFPAQPPEARKRLSETDRRRLSQGAGRNSQPLLNFNLPTRG